ncbi:DUF4279 domain-containing protein [Povalibacter sp.]|uniref:DUF4279 domain-containing protein n=1 Tax=Povalibacter sp. TaxID=1962978 RepID=UPI002F419945
MQEAPDFNVSLRIRHPEIDPAQITRKLGLQPQHVWARGDAKVPGDSTAGRRRDTYWSARLPQLLERAAQTFPLDDAVTTRFDPVIYAQFASRAIDLPAFLALHLLQMKSAKEFLQALAREGDVALVVAMEAQSGAGIRLEQALLRQIVELGLRLEFEFD